MSKRLITLLIAAFLVFAACAGGDPGGGGTTEGGGEGEGGEVSVAAVWTGAEQENFEKVLDAFEEESGATVTYEASDDLGGFLNAQVEGGNPPDVAMIPQPGLMRDLVQRDALVEIGEEAAGNLEESYAPIWSELGTVDGKLYGAYFKAASKSTWWYNTQALQQAGIQPPETWDDMIQAANTSAQAGTPWYAIGAGDAWPLTDLWENIYLQSAGPEKYDQLSNHEIPWTDQSVIESLEIMAEIFKDDYMPGGTSKMLQTAFAESVPLAFGNPPEAATVYEGDFVAGVISAETNAKVGEEADFFPFPAVTDESAGYVMGGGDAAVIMSDNETAQDLVAFLTTPEAAEVWAGAGGFISPNQDVDISVYPDEVTQRIAEQITNAETFRFDMSDLQPAEFGATAGRGMWQRFQEFMENPDDVQGIAKKLEADAKKAFGK